MIQMVVITGDTKLPDNEFAELACQILGDSFRISYFPENGRTPQQQIDAGIHFVNCLDDANNKYLIVTDSALIIEAIEVRLKQKQFCDKASFYYYDGNDFTLCAADNLELMYKDTADAFEKLDALRREETK